MSNFAIILILMSAIMHATWNLISKRSSPSTTFFLAANSIGAWIFFPWLIAYSGIIYTIPDRVWVLLILTGFFQALYCAALAGAYRHGDLSISYPIARSLPVILVPLATILIGRGELLGKWFIAGAVLILAGGALVSLEEIHPLGERRLLQGALPMAVLAAIGTTGYSMVDDRALRIIRSGLGEAYGTIPITLVYAFLEGLACTLWLGIFVLLGRKSSRGTRVHFGWAAATGVLMYLTYGMVLLAMSYARDISLIVAFRQVSILIGAFMGFVLLKEAAHRVKVLGLAILFTGLIFVALS
jgi:drug/metabolite transporter (DMT)-like permease